MHSRTFRPSRPVDVAMTLGVLSRGKGDPTIRFRADGVWRATRTPEGPATTNVRPVGPEICVRAWGSGASWALEAAPALLGDEDDDRDFVPRHDVIADAYRRHPGLRFARSQAVLEALVPTVLEQKVIGARARRSWYRMVRRYSEPAPGPLGNQLWLPPDPARLAELSSGAFHVLDVERKRADAVRLACANAAQLEATASLPITEARTRITALPGLGQWTYATTAWAALGDADAVPVGDYHFKNVVAWNLTGRPRGTDDEMLEALEPYRGHRARALRLLMLGGSGAPRYGPRLELQSIAAI